MHKSLRMIFIFIIGVFFNDLLWSQNHISSYQQSSGWAFLNGKKLKILRSFSQDGTNFYLTVNTETLQTAIYKSKELKIESSYESAFTNSPYEQALNAADTQSFNLQDSGITHGYPKEKGITLTVDLCPSHKPFDREIISQLLTEFNDIEKPVPIALSITGMFLQNHRDDIDWLKKLEQQHQIEITWINHSYHHHFDPKLPLQDNFLLESGTNINEEVLKNEVAMLEQNLLPSVFFRFPGLVSSHEVVQKITALGLIPIGSDAWLAKGQNAQSGSIVLIHGNGNEPLGIKDFIELLHAKKQEVLQKQWLLFDLRASINSEFKKD